MKTALVLGAGGFIGSHLVRKLKEEGFWVRGVDLKRPEFEPTFADDFLTYDLRDPRNVEAIQSVMRLLTASFPMYLSKVWLRYFSIQSVCCFIT